MYAFTAQQYQDVHGRFQEMGAFSPTFRNASDYVVIADEIAEAATTVLVQDK